MGCLVIFIVDVFGFEEIFFVGSVVFVDLEVNFFNMKV